LVSKSKWKEEFTDMHDYQNSTLSPEQRTTDLLSRMTLEEKIGQMIQISYNRVTPVEAEDWIKNKCAGSILHVLGDDARRLHALSRETRLGIPLICGIDAIHGHALHKGATIFPSQLAMSCGWNPGLVEAAGRVTGTEVAADGLHWTFSPVLCIGRDLRWGRIGETFGEDHLGACGMTPLRGGNVEALDPRGRFRKAMMAKALGISRQTIYN
jgi:beta-glucosidase